MQVLWFISGSASRLAINTAFEGVRLYNVAVLALQSVFHYMIYPQLAFEPTTWLHHHGCSWHKWRVHSRAHYDVKMQTAPMLSHMHHQLYAHQPT